MDRMPTNFINLAFSLSTARAQDMHLSATMTSLCRKTRFASSDVALNAMMLGYSGLTGVAVKNKTAMTVFSYSLVLCKGSIIHKNSSSSPPYPMII